MSLSFLLASPMTASLSGIFSQPERGDFRTTDLYAQVADSRPVRQFDDRIVLVDIGLSGREEIAECLEILTLCDPKVVGVDINFAEPGENDSLLLNAISLLPDAVFPLGVEQNTDGDFTISDKPFFYEKIKKPVYGVINLPAENEYASIREYAIDYSLSSGERLPSFVTAMASLGDRAITDEARKRGNQHETIDYPSREFRTIPIGDVAEHAEELSGRYVIVGATGEASDMHSTPVNSYMSGMEIHAHALSSLLDRKWYSVMPRWTDCLIALILGFSVIATALTLSGKTRGLTLRILQVALLVATVLAGYVLYLDMNLICNFTHTILILSFGLFALDIWNGAEGIVAWCATKYKLLKQQLCASES
ncbi:MAG: CHASE2 domain-containing protein [Muribaculaceae bacterium]|nr:CHASE2 domain-containing protein [Muribaculaceae bacterium]